MQESTETAAIKKNAPLRSAFDSYADPADQKNPYVSSGYGDYSRG